ncbi:MAG: hypothetical protein HZB81_05375 [Deltaproteobacteria bacterium]|nr:hypothetical protein [Deltaproteobacteria bacterium]
MKRQKAQKSGSNNKLMLFQEVSHGFQYAWFKSLEPLAKLVIPAVLTPESRGF